MPTAAQRQRLAALAKLNHQHQNQQQHQNHPAQQAQKPSDLSASRPPQPTKSDLPQPSPKAKVRAQENDWEDGAYSDDDSDEEAVAFEMDGQDNWTQNFCATCDTLIEPGQGLIAKREEPMQSQQSLHSPTSSISRASASGLKSKSGTIKGRNASADENSVNSPKRTNSAGRIHSVGAAHGALGPSKRSGSAGSRLNALSELRPTTKMYNDNNKGKHHNETIALGSGLRPRSSASSRRSSNVSVRSAQSGDHGADGEQDSPTGGPSRPKKSNGLLGSLTPAALKQQEELEAAKNKAPAALYCSERCRQIDQQRSEGLGELIYYLQQPAISPPYVTAGWQSGPSSLGAWSSRASNGNVASLATAATAGPARGSGYGYMTPESECTCAECLEKSSAGGTLPSGSSDTTESSLSYQYQNGPYGMKQRTQSGRIITPQNLVPPGSHGVVTDYFGNEAIKLANARAQQSRRRSSRLHLHRDSLSVAGTESSTRSSDSGSDLWEPRVRSHLRKSKEHGSNHAGENASSTASELERGTTTTGTVTPDGVYASTAEGLRDQSRTRSNTHDRSSDGVSATSSNPLEAMSSSQASTTGPMRLVRHGNHRGVASVDVNADVATSPQPHSSSFLSRSLASERTEDGASSGFTAVAGHPSMASFTASSFMDRRHSSRPLSRLAQETSNLSVSDGHVLRPELDRFTESPAPFGDRSSSALASRAVGTLKNTQARAEMSRSRHDSLSQLSSSLAAQRSAAEYGHGERGNSGSIGSGSGWLRNSISAAWNTIRGSSGAQIPGSESDVPGSQQAHEEEPTPTQSLIKRPTIKRGNVPSFVNEIGRGDIPGERAGDNGQSTSPRQTQAWDDMPNSAGLSKSFASTQSFGDAAAERKQQRRLERERAHRHHRSRDVSVLPPLLGVARPASGANLSTLGGMHGHRAHSVVSGAKSDPPESPSFAPVRSTTPGMLRSPRANSFVGLQDLSGTSPGYGAGAGMASSYGTSPRRAGLGWGALTPLGPPAHDRTSYGPSGSANRGYLQPLHSTTARTGAQDQYRRQHHHHHSIQHSSSRTHIPTLSLTGTIGVLGAHPHGNNIMAGRHATTPVRMSTPRVPENGGEMTGAQLKGEEEQDELDDGTHSQRFHPSQSYGRRSLLSVPPRPRSVNLMRAQHGVVGGEVYYDQHGVPVGVVPSRPPSRTKNPSGQFVHARGTSSDDGSSVKLYPVLDVPNRAPTHDCYDAGWGLSKDGLSRLLAQQPGQHEGVHHHKHLSSEPSLEATKRNASAGMGNDAAPHARFDVDAHASVENGQQQRKKLFYFDTS